MKAIVPAVAFFVFLVGLTIIGLGWAGANPPQRAQASEPPITIYHDDQRGVTCWVLSTTAYSNGGWTNIGGISCLPDGDVK